MAEYFFDTSALVKFYHAEDGTPTVAATFAEPGRKIRISALGFLETQSAFVRKVRAGALERRCKLAVDANPDPQSGLLAALVDVRGTTMKKLRVVGGIPVEEGSGNVYADLRYASSESMLVKAQLVAKIAEIIHRRALTQAHAAQILGLTQPKVSALLKGRFRGISEHRLLECLTRLGRDVHIVIKPSPRGRQNGRLMLSVA